MFEENHIYTAAWKSTLIFILYVLFTEIQNNNIGYSNQKCPTLY